MKTNMKTTRVIMAIVAATLTTGVYAQGGTAKPPVKGAAGPFVVATLPDPSFTNAVTTHGFDVTGFVLNPTVSGTNCSSLPRSQWGGTVTLNGITITIPCNMIIQMPANTFTWADMVDGGPSLTDYELSVVGNIVNNEYRAGLMYISEQSLNGAIGVISKIDYSTGNLEVTTANSSSPVVIQINDPNGRFGRAQTVDARFSVDDANPTIHAATGYPMCVPRVAPTSATPDLLCPQKNRPKPSCRNFSQAGVTPPASGELSVPAVGQVYCSQYVMPAPPSDPAVPTASTVPDARQQAPFEVGDMITFSGTRTPLGFISAHTIEANVGIYTQPGTQPSYLAIGEFGIGTADPLATAVNGAAQETQDRIFLEAETTDVKTPVDIYMVDVNASGLVQNRWVSMFEMTGECNPATTLATSCQGMSGGITTQNTGPQPQRARIRAAKSVAGILSSPSRNMRIVARSLCNATAVPRTSGLPNDLITTAGDPNAGHSASLDRCLASRLPVANGLMAGQYAAPIFEYIFPENVKPGDATVPYDFWHLPFLRYGEAADLGPLTPLPW